MLLSPHKVFGAVVSALAVGSVGSVAFSAASENKGLGDSQQTITHGSLEGHSVEGGSNLARAAETNSTLPTVGSDLSEEEFPEVDQGERKTYSFFFKGNKGVKQNIACPGPLKPDFGKTGDGLKAYIGCTQEGNDVKIDSTDVLGASDRIICSVLQGTQEFECSMISGKTYTFGEKEGMEFIYLRYL
ncbi:hypothetical protein MHLP_01230 [Candidatus Mycoplasma haematolamae str. Purdue]|uniref:Uncharacterized protein n=1 Tax=Mycoplasma haematolamae (strain Purdue) TaxID=1212765 RepID=I7CEY4_MYCHA|nr:hypothetical protein [Candidatus Mycoplasma haematolamae]AFO51826.1 hypothetical protein MHLP_01230 [Candidatus Mycoplasma haematolamae str. Purdue]